MLSSGYIVLSYLYFAFILFLCYYVENFQNQETMSLNERTILTELRLLLAKMINCVIYKVIVTKLQVLSIELSL